MEARTIVVADTEILRDLYQSLVRDLGIPCDTAANFHELYQILQETPYNGLLVDLATSVRASATEKNLLHELQQFYPVLRMRWDEQLQRLRCQIYGAMAGSNMTVQTFVDSYCRTFPARRVRREKRYPLHLNVLISPDNKFHPDKTERSTTLNVSRSGCALLTTREWQISRKIWLKILEMEDQTPLSAEIRRWTSWGTPLVLPSIGVKFISLTKAQQKQLEHPLEFSRKQGN
jgi:CheY-like chemotaxis protein